MTQFNPYAGFLEEEPGAAYFSYWDKFGGPRDSQRQRGYFGSRFSDIYNQYLGDLGRQARGAVEPTGSFNDFLGGFDFDAWYRQQSPYTERTEGFAGLVPRTQFVNPYYRT